MLMSATLGMVDAMKMQLVPTLLVRSLVLVYLDLLEMELIVLVCYVQKLFSLASCGKSLKTQL